MRISVSIFTPNAFSMRNAMSPDRSLLQDGSNLAPMPSQLHPICGAARSDRATTCAIARFLIYVIDLPLNAGMIAV